LTSAEGERFKPAKAGPKEKTSRAGEVMRSGFNSGQRIFAADFEIKIIIQKAEII